MAAHAPGDARDAARRAAWADPRNWSSFVYFSKDDDRLIVPKQVRQRGERQVAARVAAVERGARASPRRYAAHEPHSNGTPCSVASRRLLFLRLMGALLVPDATNMQPLPRPRQNPYLGWTVNLGNPWGGYVLLALVVVPAVAAAALQPGPASRWRPWVRAGP